MVTFVRPYGVDLDVSADAEYEDRVTAFLDVLGFANLVVHSESNLELRKRMIQIVRVSRTFTIGNREGVTGGIIRDRQITNFSDSIVLSELATPDKVLSVFFTISDIALSFLELGFFCRGAICVGKLYHRNDVVFGPALVSAYHLEKKVARFPRILISSEADALYRKMSFTNWMSFYEKGVVLKDFDRRMYLNILFRHWHYVEGGGQSNDVRKRLLEGVRSISIRLREQAGWNWKIRQKADWFCRFFNRVIANEATIGVPKIRWRD